MKCFCTNQEITFNNFDAVWPAKYKIGRGTFADLAIARTEKHDCNQCKHKLVCMMDPNCDRRYESR